MYSLPAHDVKEVWRACKLGIISLLPSLTRLVQALRLLKKNNLKKHKTNEIRKTHKKCGELVNLALSHFCQVVQVLSAEKILGKNEVIKNVNM